MVKYVLFKSPRDNKRFAVMNEDGKTTHFGQPGATTFADGASEAKRAAYIARHSKGGENWNISGKDTAGFWSRHLLWEEPSIGGAIKSIKRKFGIKIERDL